MNLKVEMNGIKLEIQNGDLNRVEKTLIALFAFAEGGSFVDSYGSVEEERPVNSKRNHVPTVNGIKMFGDDTHYQCAYSCSCGHTGNRFIKEDATVTNCHKCNTALQIVPSTDDAAHDEQFNYFIAY